MLEGGIVELDEIVPGMVLASLAIVIASLATAPPSATIRDDSRRFERYRQALRQH